ncbi:MAG: type I 3-dehydroquinate dehydratase, partial [Planctomycetales bacterium]|nr:type I 3-dehydroquinate dehydratase [Planctomycetales bacterium]
MLCVTIARSRHKAMIAEFKHLAENGAELIEMRLDYIGRHIDLTRLLADRSCPVVVTCRRREDGGRWEKSEEERLMILRSAIASGVDFVDLEEDIADSIPRYGQTKRIVSLHNF